MSTSSMEFGTGALKITPGHDPNDYDIAQRHNLPIISMLDAGRQGQRERRPVPGPGSLRGAQEALGGYASRPGWSIKTEPYHTTIPRSQRGGEIVEPMISTQWFVKIEPLAEAALAAVRDGRIKIVPERFEKVYFNWLENIKDWCISRQLWWGHRIPVWYCADGHMTVGARRSRRSARTCGSTELTQDDGCAGYLVLVGPVAVLHAGLARGDARPEILLSHLRAWKPATTSCSSGWRA